MSHLKCRIGLALAGAILIADPLMGSASAIEPQNFPNYLDFEGRFLAVLSDVDMVASAYMGPPIGPRSESMRDQLTLFPLRDGMPGEPVQIPVTNAVTAWPSLLSFAPDGRTAYVAETEKPAGPDAQSRADLQPSGLLSVVAIDESLRGAVVQTIETDSRAVAVDVRPQGDVLVVSTTRPGHLATGATQSASPQLGLFRIGPDGRLGEMATLSLEGAQSDPPHIEWSPDGSLLAVTMARSDSVRFYIWDGSALSPYGNAVSTGKLPGVGHWSPSGSHFFVTNLHWGRDAEGIYLGSDISTIAAIRVAAAEAEDPRHLMVSAIATGASAEEFAISPDGEMLVSLNMEHSFLPPEDPRLTYHSSLSLITWDEESETLHSHGDFAFEGILPEGITFDGSGQFLAVANFAHSNPRRPVEETTVDFWRVVTGASPALVQMDLKLPVMRGAHVVQLQR